MSKSSRRWKTKWKNTLDDRIFLIVNGSPCKVVAKYDVSRKNRSKKEYMMFKRQCDRLSRGARK